MSEAAPLSFAEIFFRLTQSLREGHPFGNVIVKLAHEYSRGFVGNLPKADNDRATTGVKKCPRQPYYSFAGNFFSEPRLARGKNREIGIELEIHDLFHSQKAVLPGRIAELRKHSSRLLEIRYLVRKHTMRSKMQKLISAEIYSLEAVFVCILAETNI